MRAPRITLLTAGLLVAGLAGCGHFVPGRNLFGETRRDLIHLHVDNQNASDAVLHVLHDRRRIAIGTAPAGATTTYAIDWSPGGVRALRVEIELAGESRPCITDVMMVDSGEEIQLEIEARFRFMRWCER